MKKAYQTYKETEIPWLPKMPSSWRQIKFKYLFNERVEKGYPDEPLLAATQTQGVIPKEMYETRTVTAQKDFHLLKLVKVGDFVISLRSFQGGIEYAHFQGIISPAYTILKPLHEVHGGYFRHLLKSKNFIDDLTTYVTGIREGQNINYSALRDALAPIPPLPEQRTIAAFLDHKCALIDTFIQKKTHLIALLKEQKQAIINRAVTKGLDPEVPMKPSGVDWLGDIPAHWKVVPNRSLFSLKKDVVGENHSSYSLLSLTTKGVIRRDIESGEGKFPESFESYQKIMPGDLIFCLFDIEETPRTVGIVAEEGMITGAYTRFECKNPNYLKFIYYYYLSIDEKKDLKPLYSGLRKVIKKSVFLSTKMPKPPENEQKRIIEHIESELEIIHKTITHIEEEIGLTKEYKTTLIAEAVTGKIDVRGWQAKASFAERHERNV